MGTGTQPYGRAAVERLPLVRAPRRRAAAVAGALLVAGGLAVAGPLPHVAWAKFSAAAAGSARSGAQSVPASASPVVVVTVRDAAVSWSPTTLSGGTPAAGYVIRRYDVAHNLQTLGAGCAGTVTTNSCTEISVPTGVWQYTVQAVHHGWTGAMSGFSASVTVGTASLVFTSPTTLTTLPATLNGNIAQFDAGTALSFRLDSPTGPVLSGTPSTVPASGASAITVTIPAGTSDAPHAVFAVDSLGTAASAAFSYVDPPDLLSLTMHDLDGNGKVDTVRATFDETLAAYTAGVSPWTVTNVPSAGSLASVTVAGTVATLTFTEGAGAATTAVGSFTVALTTNSGGIRDANGNLSSFTTRAPTDAAAPAPVTAVMQDANSNGKVDLVAYTFSETLAAYTAGNGPWSLTSAPSGATLASVAVGATTANLNLTEGAGAADTGLGSFTVNLAASATGIRDAAGNLTTFSRQPNDGAKPIRLSQDMYDVDLDGRVDRVTVTFSETLAAYTAGTGVWAFASPPSGATLSSVSVAGAVATLNLNEGTGTATTAVGAFTIALTANAAGIRDAAGNLSSYTAAAPTDRAAPAAIAVTLLDNNGNGKVDRVTLTFSEALANYSAGTAVWTVANVPSGGALNAVNVSSPNVTLTLNEGAGAQDTSVGSMTVALAASATGIRDAAGNLTSFAARAPADGARPVTVTVTDTNGATDGKIEPGDSIVITLSEALSAATVPASATVTLTDPNGGGNDTLAITGVMNGNRSTGSNNYVTLNNSSAAFANSTVTLGNGGKTITVVVGPVCSGTGCAALGTVANTPNLSYQSATTLTDPAGNAATGTKTVAIRLF